VKYLELKREEMRKIIGGDGSSERLCTYEIVTNATPVVLQGSGVTAAYFDPDIVIGLNTPLLAMCTSLGV